MPETKKKILIIEDDLALVDVLSNKLKLDGFDVSSANDGQAGVEALDKGKFDLVMLDLNMPWFDGFHVLEDQQKKNLKTPIIIMSSLAGREDINRAKSLGAIDYLVKTSVTPELIVKEIHKHLK